MNDDMLSQDEIDALLKGTSSLDEFSEPNKSSQVDDYFTEMEKTRLAKLEIFRLAVQQQRYRLY